MFKILASQAAPQHIGERPGKMNLVRCAVETLGHFFDNLPLLGEAHAPVLLLADEVAQGVVLATTFLV